jgi:Tfp pilus assembly protein PilF
MHNQPRIWGWAVTVLVISLFLLFFSGCGKKTEKTKESTEQVKKRVELGVQYLKENKANEALQELSQAIQLDPDYADAHFYLGALYHALTGYSPAIKEYEEVLRINPSYPKIHTALANVYYERGLRAWGKAIKLDRVTYWFPDTLKQLPFKNRDELVGLIEEYTNKLEADTLNAETFSKLSQANFLLAAEEYQKAIQVDSLDTNAQLYLGLTYSEQGYPHKAMAQHDVLNRLDPRSGDLLLTVLRQKEKEKQDLEKYKK